MSDQHNACATESRANVSCPGCGCVCDDLSVSFRDGELAEFAPSCALGESWFRRCSASVRTAAEIDGHPASTEEAIDRAVSLLLASDFPLIYGLSRSATAGQRAAVSLAEKLGAAIDTTASLCHGPSIMALQETGEVTCTLGEIRNRADLVIFWGCNPAISHPRHAERYSVFPKGKHVPGGRSDRTIVMVGDSEHVRDWRLNSAGSLPDIVIPIESGRDFEALCVLRALLQGRPLPDTTPDLQLLFDLMRGCRYGIVFFGLGIAETSMWDGNRHAPVGHVNVAALLKLVAELNSITRFTARRMRLQGDVSGADNVMCWQTGYPFAVDFSRGYPRYNPGEYSANELLQEQNVDACVMVGAETVPFFSEAARQHLRSIPTIVLDYPDAPLEFTPSVRFTTSVYGLNTGGTIYRMDNVPLPLRVLRHSNLLTDEQILSRIGAHASLILAEPGVSDIR